MAMISTELDNRKLYKGYKTYVLNEAATRQSQPNNNNQDSVDTRLCGIFIKRYAL